jgi:hypothetical protein
LNQKTKEHQLNEKKKLQGIFDSMQKMLYCRRFLLFLILAFLAGCLFTGFFFDRFRFTGAGELDKRYYSQYGRAAETIGRLEEELRRERQLNSQLREHNSRARELAGGLTGTVERNVRNLQDAVAIIGEIREKLKVLADFYANSSPGNSAH